MCYYVTRRRKGSRVVFFFYSFLADANLDTRSNFTRLRVHVRVRAGSETTRAG
jgi:hypothetical protein